MTGVQTCALPISYLNSPRSLDACRRQGIEPEELIYLDINSFKETLTVKYEDKELLNLLWNHREEKRKEKIVMVREVINWLIIGASTYNR